MCYFISVITLLNNLYNFFLPWQQHVVVVGGYVPINVKIKPTPLNLQKN